MDADASQTDSNPQSDRPLGAEPVRGRGAFYLAWGLFLVWFVALALLAVFYPSRG